jgi:CheY-like chemotaxis protein
MTQSPDMKAIILVVEDEWLIRTCIVSQLRDAGFVVYGAENAKEGLIELKTHAAVTTVFSDINMPGRIDGLRLMHRISHLRPDVRLIITSGRGEPAKGRMPKLASFLHKPYECSALIDMILAA